MDNKWVEKDGTLQKMYNDTLEKNSNFKEKFPTYNTFCENISDKYKSEAKTDDDGKQSDPEPNKK